MKKIGLYLIVFLILQVCIPMVVMGLWRLATGSADLTALMLTVAMALYAVATVAVFVRTGWAEVSPHYFRTRPYLVLLWSVVAAVGAIIPSMWLQEQLPDLPDLNSENFTLLMANRWGYFAIGLLVPLAEEIVFRGAILKELLNKYTAQNAILISALIFAVAHFNPAQMPHAFLVGLLLGWMYWRTGSILPGVAFHWANNSIAYVLFRVLPDNDATLLELLGSQRTVYMAVGFSLLILLPALFQLHVWMKRND
ncbi:MAG: CPBP family intramembrane metalloprotease [Prevotella sp.]|nr:CPBP family intramembrane metalloprotease [Prevotella sp.]